MATFYVEPNGETYGFYDDVNEIPWFQKVLAEAQERLAKVPESCQSEWYKEQMRK